jgi:hypothetical protein
VSEKESDNFLANEEVRQRMIYLVEELKNQGAMSGLSETDFLLFLHHCNEIDRILGTRPYDS